ncbi:MAG: hypothetical protein U1E29_14550 [Coriobacteriia bacterium]|nr:hypothetical protein [Coriobacteriia bacterium]
MKTKLIGVVATVALLLAAVALGACSTNDDSIPDGSSADPPAGTPGRESRLAPGLYDLEDGTVQAVGTLEWVDLEGGFWAITGGTEAEGNVGTTVAVIANHAELDSTLRPLEGSQVLASGTRFEGASIRMAGPEIEVESIEAFDDAPGIAE